MRGDGLLRTQRGNFAVERVELFKQLGVAVVGDRRLKGFNVERTVRFQLASLHLAYMFKALAVNHLNELFYRERLAFERLFIDFSVSHQHSGTALKQVGQSWRAEERAYHQPVDGQEAKCADNASGHRVVFADDGVLYRIREREQHNKIERVQLCQFTLSKQAQQQHQHQVHDDGTGQLFDKRKRHFEHVVEDDGMCHGIEDSDLLAGIPDRNVGMCPVLFGYLCAALFSELSVFDRGFFSLYILHADPPGVETPSGPLLQRFEVGINNGRNVQGHQLREHKAANNCHSQRTT